MVSNTNDVKTLIHVNDIVKDGLINCLCKDSELYNGSVLYVTTMRININTLSSKSIPFKYVFDDTNYVYDFYIDMNSNKIINTDIYKEYTNANDDIINIWNDIINLKAKYTELISKAIQNPQQYKQTYKYLLDLVIHNYEYINDMYTPSDMSWYKMKLIYNSYLWDAFSFLNNNDEFYEEYKKYFSILNIKHLLKNNPDINHYYENLYNNMKIIYNFAKDYNENHGVIKLLKLQNV